MKFDNQLRYALKIIEDYDGSIPLAAWLKNFYNDNRQMGSRDRKTVSEMVYCYYRLGQNQFESAEQRMLTAFALSPHLKEALGYFKATREINAAYSLDKILPSQDELSDGIDKQAFATSFLVQPDVFFRLRPGHESSVIAKLEKSGIPFSKHGEYSIALKSATDAGKVVDINREAVVQDLSSQRTADLLNYAKFPDDQKIDVWDCCAASGGKSIMVYDRLKNIKLTVSDIRESIIHNLENRFRKAGITNYKSIVTDLTKRPKKIPAGKFDLVIADVPCSGSGTWARTPEQLYFSTPNKIDYYSRIQHTILENILPFMKPDGYLLYITCSVFKKENEVVVQHLQGKGLKVVKQQLFTGYDVKADTMFAALLTSSSA